MDPNATLRRWRQAVKDGDRTEARYAREDLASWIRHGGFLPTGLTPKERRELGLPKQDAAGRLRATRVRINRQGYDSRGKYWGVGAPLYHVYSMDGEIDEHVRAQDAVEARRRFRPNPLRCKGTGPQNNRKLHCVGKRNPCNPCENPRRHFPLTNRGRPKVARHWTADIYADPDGPKLGRKKLSTDKQDAYDAARDLVGTRYRGKIVRKVILDGPT